MPYSEQLSLQFLGSRGRQHPPKEQQKSRYVLKNFLTKLTEKIYSQS
jgi:hypothetical protein